MGTLVLIHGSSGAPEDWHEIVQRLAPRFKVLTPTLPGHGDSAPRPADDEPSTGWAAEQLEPELAELQEPLLIVGHGYGGNVALTLALRGRVPLRGLVLSEPWLVNALLIASGDVPHSITARAMEAYVASAEAGEPGAPAALVEHWYGPGAWQDFSEPDRERLKNGTAATVEDLIALFGEIYRAGELSRLDLPVFIIQGGGSPSPVTSIVTAIHALLRNTTGESIFGARHGLLTTHPEAVADLIAKHAESCFG